MDTTTVLVLGGGYAGVMAANRLAGSGRENLDVLLVNPGDRFVERIRLHEYAAGTRDDPTLDFGTVLHPAVRQVRAAAARIDAGARRVELADGRSLPFDYLIYAVGSGRPPAPEGTLAVQDLAGAAAVRSALEALEPGGRVAVVGGGYTALEAAAETAGQHPRLSVSLHAAGVLGPHLSEPARRGLAAGLRRAGVSIRSGEPVPADGDARARLGADVVLWCTGFGVPGLAGASGLPVDGRGRLRVDATLAVPGLPHIYGVGDAALLPEEYAYLEMTCATAMPMGAHAAENLLHALDGKPATRHDSGFLGRCISLGRSDGVVQFVAADNTPRRLHLHGRTAAVLKEVICRMTVRWMRGEAKRSGAYTWPKGPRPAAQTTEPAWT